jgi:hypothetical protein
MPTKLDEVREKLDAKRLELHNIFEEAGEDLDLSKVKSFEGKDDISRRTEIKKRNDELTELGKEFDALREIADAAQNVKNVDERLKQPVNRAPKGGGNTELIVPPKGLRQLLEESASYKAFREAGGKGTAVIEVSEAELKTLMTLSTINNPASRAPGIVGPPEEERTVRDLILQGTTDNNALTYMEETTTTNNASTLSPKAAPSPSPRWPSPSARTTSARSRRGSRQRPNCWPTSAGIESYIRSRLSFFVKRTEESAAAPGRRRRAEHPGHGAPHRRADAGEGRRPDARRRLQGHGQDHERTPLPTRRRSSSTRWTGRTSACCAPPTASTSGATL